MINKQLLSVFLRKKYEIGNVDCIKARVTSSFGKRVVFCGKIIISPHLAFKKHQLFELVELE